MQLKSIFRLTIALNGFYLIYLKFLNIKEESDHLVWITRDPRVLKEWQTVVLMGYLQTLTCRQLTWDFCESVDSESQGLEWGPRSCSSQ